MKGIRIFMEGGGAGTGGKGGLRGGMDEFLRLPKHAATMAGLSWRLMLCGSRDETRKRFLEAPNDGAQWVDILLVDAEAAVTASPRDHLRQRDGWGLGAARDGSVHLMAQVMETWIVADPDALVQYYGQGFNRGKLPRRSDLEREPKLQVLRGLKDATKRTSKGGYHKIKHAGKLLARIDPARVRERCGHCDQFFKALDGIVAAGRTSG